MKKWLDEPKNLFGLLMAASVLAIVMGLYLGLVLGILPEETLLVRATLHSSTAAALNDLPDLALLTRLVTGVCMALWCVAWGAFYGLCRRLHRGEGAFQASTGRTLRIIGWSCLGMAAAVLARGVPAAVYMVRLMNGIDVYTLIETILLPGTFLTVALIAHILRGLLMHAIALEEEQEGVV